jgi:DNA-binding SARP family transcriptional activator
MKICVLGPVGASRGGREVRLGGSKPRTLLAALILAHGRLVPDSQLSELLWGWQPPATESAQLCTYVSRLRSRLAPEVDIVRQPPGYLLRVRSAEFDYEVFERLTLVGQEYMNTGQYASAAACFQSALDLWTGPALANVTEFLASTELPRLDEARMAAVESRIDADLRLGRHLRLVSELTKLVAQYPMRERLRAQLMTALYHCGRQADAMAVFHEGRHMLSDELGVRPGAGLIGAYQAILRGNPTLLTEPEPEPALRGTGLRTGRLIRAGPGPGRVLAQSVEQRDPAVLLRDDAAHDAEHDSVIAD